MGVAAYNRGSHLIRTQLAETVRPSEFVWMEELNQLERYPDAGKPFGPVRILYDAPHKVWWLQDALKGDRGWGWWYASLRELCKRWQIVIVSYDATTGIYQAEPDAKPECNTLDAWLYRCQR